LVNGSGLFDGNLIAATHITHVLRYMYLSPAHRSEYLSMLAVGGDEGTLHSRLRNLPAPRIVRAKTGTLNDVSGLSGVITREDGVPQLAFSILTNARDVGSMAAPIRRQFEDRIVMALLWALDDYEAQRTGLTDGRPRAPSRGAARAAPARP
ncbi:MAG TPA: D-alanyl-D-alanine carboxypeptidase, partial [Nannocystaceae bacterium]|nr:D-alanyl-D-alanine carboxypeptidase [Nannocystaceae bacterium]